MRQVGGSLATVVTGAIVASGTSSPLRQGNSPKSVYLQGSRDSRLMAALLAIEPPWAASALLKARPTAFDVVATSRPSGAPSGACKPSWIEAQTKVERGDAADRDSIGGARRACPRRRANDPAPRVQTSEPSPAGLGEKAMTVTDQNRRDEGEALPRERGGLWAHAEWWRAFAVTGAALSLLFFVVFFQPVILFGLALDVAIIVALVWLKWPSESMVGA
jgi:hypothetical protein